MILRIKITGMKEIELNEEEYEEFCEDETAFVENDTLYEIIGQSLVIDSAYCFSKFSIEELRKFKKM